MDDLNFKSVVNSQFENKEKNQGGTFQGHLMCSQNEVDLVLYVNFVKCVTHVSRMLILKNATSSEDHMLFNEAREVMKPDIDNRN